MDFCLKGQEFSGMGCRKILLVKKCKYKYVQYLQKCEGAILSIFYHMAKLNLNSYFTKKYDNKIFCNSGF